MKIFRAFIFKENQEKLALTLPPGGGKNCLANKVSLAIREGANSKGFTLAEVLITLGIIGVVAAVTMPTLIKNYQKQVTVNRLKETYSILSQALQRAVVEHDTPANWTYDDNNIDLFVENYIAPYAKIINKSATAPEHYQLNGSSAYLGAKRSAYYYLPNGVEFIVLLDPAWNSYYFIDIDLNGAKGPNKLGKDTFKIHFNKTTNTTSLTKALIFNGIDNKISDIKNNCSKSGNGAYCGAWIMREGWKIPEDYPW